MARTASVVGPAAPGLRSSARLSLRGVVLESESSPPMASTWRWPAGCGRLTLGVLRVVAPPALGSGGRRRESGGHHRRDPRRLPGHVRRAAGARRAASRAGSGLRPRTGRPAHARRHRLNPAGAGGARGPGAPPVRRRRPRPAVGHRHHRAPTAEGKVYCAAVLDVFSRVVVGWSIADHMRSELVVALEMARWRRRPTPGAVVHSDRGSEPSTPRSRSPSGLPRAASHPSVGSVGDALDNALAESQIGLFKTELIRRRDPERPSTTSTWPPWNGSTGTTTDGCIRPATTSPRSNTSRSTTVPTPPSSRPESQHPESPDSPGRFIDVWIWGYEAPGE